MPAEQIESVVKALYADADRGGWEHLSPNQRTAQYDKWVSDPEIGGLLTEYMSSETARSWIKDGPMKEYARALQGAGRYARFGSSLGPTPTLIARHALGPGAIVIDGSTGVKPFHGVASVEGGTKTYLAWGEAKNFRYLVWACLNYLAATPGVEAVIVVTETMADPTTAAERSRLAIIADRCSLGLKYYRTAAAKRVAAEGGAS
ncbi:hypothetical protein [Kineosporia sp. R_H_3]|uniref:hypothetical protein n=1 Tax=Kineosporia sp. R_H_3 TaxID=1961848 RepID=UPI00117B2B35|nr:hypothetical protein [Kineosporia sp. R_H_3]